MTGQSGPEMLGDMLGCSLSGGKIGQILDIEVVCKAEHTVGMKAEARHGCSLIAWDPLKRQQLSEAQQ
jgi:hypothetical protein